MSTLSISRPTVDDVEARFEVLARQSWHLEPATVDFDTVFDLDYGSESAEAAAAPRPERVSEGGCAPSTQRRESLGRSRRAPVRLTRRGRTAVATGFLVAALGVMTLLGGLATATLTGGTPPPVRVVEVHSGDTLYSIASSVARPGHVREVVYRIQELNSLPDADIHAGQKLAVPLR